MFARPQHRLLADDAFAADFLLRPVASVMIQCRVRGCAVSLPELVMTTV